MSRFKVGDKVRVVKEHGRKGIDGPFLGNIVEIVEGSGDTSHPTYRISGYNDWKSEDRFELVVDKPVSKRVKVTVEGEVDGGYVKLSNESYIYLDNILKSNGAVEYLPDPVVLPTKQYAIVRVGFSTPHVLRDGTWFRAGTDFGYTPRTIVKWAEKEGYTIVFEGEDA